MHEQMSSSEQKASAISMLEKVSTICTIACLVNVFALFIEWQVSGRDVKVLEKEANDAREQAEEHKTDQK